MQSDDSWSRGQADTAWIESLARPLHPVFAATGTEARPTRIPILDRDVGRVLAVLGDRPFSGSVRPVGDGSLVATWRP